MIHVNEIFTSLSGEPDGFGNQGGLATFIRLQGCNLECKWCDTPNTRGRMSGIEQTIENIILQCKTHYIIVTGGEPLLQNETRELISRLVGKRHSITIETNGSQPANYSHAEVRFVMDYKLPSSGMEAAMVIEHFEALCSDDIIKFVMRDLYDYKVACEVITQRVTWRARKIFSPTSEHKEWPAILTKHMIEDKLQNIRLSLQLHKQLAIR